MYVRPTVQRPSGLTPLIFFSFSSLLSSFPFFFVAWLSQRLVSRAWHVTCLIDEATVPFAACDVNVEKMSLLRIKRYERGLTSDIAVG